MFIAVLFTIARAWKQPKCLPTEQWIRKMWYIIQPLKKNNNAIGSNMDGPRDWHTE